MWVLTPRTLGGPPVPPGFPRGIPPKNGADPRGLPEPGGIYSDNTQEKQRANAQKPALYSPRVFSLVIPLVSIGLIHKVFTNPEGSPRVKCWKRQGQHPPNPMEEAETAWESTQTGQGQHSSGSTPPPEKSLNTARANAQEADHRSGGLSQELTRAGLGGKPGGFRC